MIAEGSNKLASVCCYNLIKDGGVSNPVSRFPLEEEVVVEALLLLPLVVVGVRLLPLKRRRKRKRRKKRFAPCHVMYFYDLLYIFQEESDDDMGFGLFD